MIKKILLLLLLSVLSMTFVACDFFSSTTTISELPTSSTTLTTITTTIPPSTTTKLTTQLIDTIPTECSGIAIEDGWVPTWCDEFSYTGAVDSTKWNHQTGGGGFGNSELQYYTNRSVNAYVEEGHLTITALKEAYGGSSYTSSKIWTQGIEDFRYGKIEMRAKLPSGKGTWPAFWMMPTSSQYGGWPKSGEIDIMEHVGYDPNRVLGTLHTERFSGTNGRGYNTDSLLDNGTLASIDVLNEFHTYGIIWTNTSIEWFFDGYSLGSVSYNPSKSNSYLYPTSVDWPFDQKFYIILNLAIGGTWGGAMGVDDTIFPATYVIDYVRVYEQDYISDDTENPSIPTRLQVLSIDDRTAYLTWSPSVDDNAIRRYKIYVNGLMEGYTSVNGIQLKGLPSGQDNIISVIAEDYAGKLSSPMETVITIE